MLIAVLAPYLRSGSEIFDRSLLRIKKLRASSLWLLIQYDDSVRYPRGFLFAKSGNQTEQ